MKIGIDLDGVSADIISPYLRFYNERYGTTFMYNDIKDHDFWGIFGISRGEAIERMHEFFIETDYDLVQPIEGAVEAIKSLGEKNKLIAITARPLVYKTKTLSWIEKHLPGVFEKVIFTNQYSKEGSGEKTTKHAIIQQEGVEIFIEDYDKYVRECAPYCKKVLMFDQPWNKNSTGFPDNVVRIESWDEVINVLGDM